MLLLRATLVALILIALHYFFVRQVSRWLFCLMLLVLGQVCMQCLLEDKRRPSYCRLAPLLCATRVALVIVA